jgi:hypothetical protein
MSACKEREEKEMSRKITDNQYMSMTRNNSKSRKKTYQMKNSLTQYLKKMMMIRLFIVA